MVREAEALPEPRSQAARELLEFGARPANGGSSPPSLYLAVTPFLCLCLSGAEQVHARTQPARAGRCGSPQLSPAQLAACSQAEPRVASTLHLFCLGLCAVSRRWLRCFRAAFSQNTYLVNKNIAHVHRS